MNNSGDEAAGTGTDNAGAKPSAARKVIDYTLSVEEREAAVARVKRNVPSKRVVSAADFEGLDKDQLIAKLVEATQQNMDLEYRLDMLALKTDKVIPERAAHRKAAHTDLLTGAANRRACEISATDAFKHMMRFNPDRNGGHGQNIDAGTAPQKTFVLMDLDFFSNLNNTYGHDVGDAALQHTAEFFKNNLRPGDKFGRWGGEEFLLILNGDEQHATIAMERLRKKFAETQMEYHGPIKGGYAPYLAFSYGASELTLEDSNGIDARRKPEDMDSRLAAVIKRADVKLYEDKGKSGDAAKPGTRSLRWKEHFDRLGMAVPAEPAREAKPVGKGEPSLSA